MTSWRGCIGTTKIYIVQQRSINICTSQQVSSSSATTQKTLITKKKLTGFQYDRFYGIPQTNSILFYTFINIFDISDSSYFASCFVEKYLSYVFGHLHPVYFIESIAKTGKNVGVFLLPYFAQCECCPEHLSVV